MQLSTIADFKVGKYIFGFFQCVDKSLRITRLGDPFIDLQLKDSYGKIKGKIWSNVDFFSEKFNMHDIVSVKAEVIEFNNNKELNIKFISSENIDFYKEYGFKKNLIVGSINESPSKLLSFIYKEIATLPFKDRKIVKNIFKENENLIKSIPIDKDNYFLRGGFIKYLYDLFKLNFKIEKNFNNLDSVKIKVCLLTMNLGYIKFYNNDDTFTRTSISKSLSFSNLTSIILSSHLLKLKDEEKIFYIKCANCDDESIEKNILYVKCLISLNNL